MRPFWRSGTFVRWRSWHRRLGADTKQRRPVCTPEGEGGRQGYSIIFAARSRCESVPSSTAKARDTMGRSHDTGPPQRGANGPRRCRMQHDHMDALATVERGYQSGHVDGWRQHPRETRKLAQLPPPTTAGSAAARSFGFFGRLGRNRRRVGLYTFPLSRTAPHVGVISLRWSAVVPPVLLLRVTVDHCRRIGLWRFRVVRGCNVIRTRVVIRRVIGSVAIVWPTPRSEPATQTHP